MRTFSPGGRREIIVVCPDCKFQSSVPPTAVGRNAYFCSSCGKSVDLLTQSYQPPAPTGDGTGPRPGPRRDRGSSKYKSARKGRR